MSFQASWMKRSIKNIVKGSDKQDNSFAEIILLILAIGAGDLIFSPSHLEAFCKSALPV